MATMNQLWAWEYKGKTEWGFMEPQMNGNPTYVAYHQNGFYRTIRQSNQVTNLRKVKVVDEEAVVIDAIPLSIIQLAVQEGIDGINEWQRKTYPRPDEAVKARGALHTISQIVRGYSITPTPPVTEPKNFGAIVKWGTNEAFLNREGEWIHTETFHRYSWGKILRECQRPTIISEGVEG